MLLLHLCLLNRNDLLLTNSYTLPVTVGGLGATPPSIAKVLGGGIWQCLLRRHRSSSPPPVIILLMIRSLPGLFPVLLQVATAVGVDPIQFAIVVVMNLVLGLCTPPVGVCLFAATAIGGNKLSENVKALTPFLISNFTVLFLVTYVPALSVGVANLIMGK